MTAIEWLIEQFNNNNAKFINWSEEYFEQAKEMEKQQIINTWYDCKLSIIEKNPTDADQYFKETFEK